MEQYRLKINEIDQQIMALFEQRMEQVCKVAQYKKENNLPIFDSTREQIVINKNLDLIQNENIKPYAKQFILDMMEVSKLYQKVSNNIDVSENESSVLPSKYGLIGHKLGHSLSPEIHEEFFVQQNINAEYNLYEVPKKQVANIVKSLKTLGFKGANVTIPYKNVVIPQLDEISTEAQKIGAVNTIHIENGYTKGYNTDYYGFGRMLEKEKVCIANNVFYILGGGGSAKAVICYLRDNGAKKVILVTRNVDNAKKEFSDIEIIGYSGIKDGYAIINTTPLGMSPNVDSSPVNAEVLSKFEVAIDLIYNPEQTKFLIMAKQLGLQTISGLFMLVAQAIKAEEIWQNKTYTLEQEIEIYTHVKNYIFGKHIYLIGFMGAGKTSVGPELAKLLDIPFIDCDKEIEKEAGKSISEIFAQDGETYFRKLEHNILLKASSKDRSIIATGGGCVMYPPSFDFLENKQCVYLDTDFETLYKRVKDDVSRPLVEEKENMYKRFQDRLPIYKKLARTTVHYKNLAPYEIAYEIKNLVGGK
ncbi:MAG: hypothetical protein ATN36_06030 [Epulopiscium sp. Nele67-Bin005]|nr:MAG: hypothetical protein ATN36_06030 [Epulopiscium sp. Nele67-Bin005]